MQGKPRKRIDLVIRALSEIAAARHRIELYLPALPSEGQRLLFGSLVMQLSPEGIDQVAEKLKGMKE